jgi:hypothetical protein
MTRFLTADDVADLMPLSVSHIRRHYQELGGIRIGRRIMFPEGVIRHLAAYGTLPEWPDPRKSASTSVRKAATVSAGVSTGSNTRSADTRPKPKPTTVRQRSGSAFSRDFPEFAHLVR